MRPIPATVHRHAGAEMLPNGDAVHGCWCGAWFRGPPEEAAEGFRDHLVEPALLRRGEPARRTVCPQGHAYTPENTRVDPRTGKRKCRACHRDRERSVRRGL